MDMGIIVDVFATQLDVLAVTKTHIKVRTKEIIPFWGDYAVGELQLTINEAEMMQHWLATSEDERWLVCTVDCDNILNKAADVIRKQLRDYVVELLQSEAVRLGNQPFNSLYK